MSKARNAIQEATERAADLIAAAQMERAELPEKIAAFERAEQEAHEREKEAEQAGDAAGYVNATRARADAQTALSMLYSRRDTLTRPLVTEQEYNSTVNAILADWQAAEQAARERLADMAEEAAEIAADLERKTNDANAVLHTWQHELYRDADRAKSRSGAPYTDTDRKQIKDFSACTWGRLAINHYQYQITRKTGRGITQAGADPWTAGNRYKAPAAE